MHPTRLAFLATVLATVAALPAHAADTTRYLDLRNRAHDSVVAVAIAPAGSDTYQPRPITALTGGGDATTLALAGDTCRYDLRLTFKDGRTARYTDVDVCRGRTLVIAPLPASAAQAQRPVANAAVPPPR